MLKQTPVCDYEGSDYHDRFWKNQGRDYEDGAERVALRRLLIPEGERLIDIGAGFGRLADEYRGYRRVVLFDYSRSLLREAQARLAGDPRFLFVAGNWYRMPFVSGLFDALVQVRTIHHAADVPALFRQLARIARPDGHYVLEFASKRNIKAILRFWARRQEWSPFNQDPIEFATLNYDFHPRWIERQAREVGFRPGRKLAVSHFRLAGLKRLLPAGLLVAMDRLLQPTGNWIQLSPSVFMHSEAPINQRAAGPGEFFACPECQTSLGEVEDDRLICPNISCGCQWSFVDGLYDFKEPL